MPHNQPKIGEATAKGETPLQTVGSSLSALARQTWLHYYNDYLRAHGVITEGEWRKIRCMIERD